MMRLCQQHGLPFPPPNRRVVVHKKRRRLELFSGRILLKTYKVALSYKPDGDKEREGDCRVPEGEFYVCEKHPSRMNHLFIGLSYPAIEDAKRGLKQGLITKAQYKAIVEANRLRRQPPWDTPLGGEVGIHGGGILWDWTIGCIALRNPDADELYVTLQLGDPVVIKP